jgi:ABC-2 type transport system permease protein
MTEQPKPIWAAPMVVVCRPWLAVGTLSRREIVRFFRQRNRIIGAVGQPLIFWLLFSAGFHQSFRLAADTSPGAISFQQYYFPGTLMLILMFTAIFATISIIEDRREGFLQSVLVAPIPRWSMVLGKVFGGSLIALMQGVLFLLLALAVGIELTVAKVCWMICLMAIVATGLTSLGLLIAWRMESTQGFHAIMSLFLMPLWLMSGAFFPVPALANDTSWSLVAMHWLMRCNPLTYGIAGAQRILFTATAVEALHLPPAAVCWLVTVGFAAATFSAAWIVAGTRMMGELR